MRKLATIKKIDNLTPIEGADRIELATVGGWKVVVAKDVGHSIGNLVVYCEVDSFLPIEPEFEFLRASSFKKMGEDEGFRLKTIKLRGQISQGLILPLMDAINVMKRRNGSVYMEMLKEGNDVSDLLGIVKYEPPIPAQLSGMVKGNFPGWGRKTDQERCQNLVNEIHTEIENDSVFEISIKLDGSSMSVGHYDGDKVVCSRNLSLKLEQEGNTYIDVAKNIGLLDRIAEFGNIMISGELCGPGIQGNPEKLKEHKFFVFDILDVDLGSYMSGSERMKIVKELNLDHVPVLGEYTLKDLNLVSVEDILKYAEGPSLNAGNREGLVFKRVDGGFSFKAISNKYLLKTNN